MASQNSPKDIIDAAHCSRNIEAIQEVLQDAMKARADADIDDLKSISDDLDDILQSMKGVAPEESFADRLHTARKKQGLSQAAMATATGVSPRAYHAYEKGQREPSWAFVVKFTIVCNLDAEWIMFGEKGRTDAQTKGVD